MNEQTNDQGRSDARTSHPAGKAPMQLAVTEGRWRRSEVTEPERWLDHLSAAELDDLTEIVAMIQPRQVESLTRADLPASGPIAEASQRWRRALGQGLGFVVVRGLKPDELTPEQLARSFLVLGLHLGAPVPQNLRGELLVNIRDTGADPTLPTTRLYTTRAEQDYHTDGADIVGLLCRCAARRGGLSRIVSSTAIVAELARTEPALYGALFEDIPWYYQEDGSAPVIVTRPICNVTRVTPEGAHVSTFFIPWYISRSQAQPGAPRLTSNQAQAIEAILQLANDPALYLDMPLEPGDIQWLKNASILHKRTAYEDFDEPARKRHMLRLWLSAPDLGDGDQELRKGITRELSR